MLKRSLAIAPLVIGGLVGCSSSNNSDRAVPVPDNTNSDGTPTVAIQSSVFDPAGGVIPFPNNLLLSGTTDLTINIPVADPTDLSDPQVAINALDGWSTVSPWTASFAREVAASSVVPGDSVRFFEVTLTGPGGAVTGVVRELTPGVEYVAVKSTVNPNGIAVVPIQPLDQLTTYMAVATNGITDTIGTNATPSDAYFVAQRTTPLVDAQGNSTDPLLPNASAQALEPLRQLVNANEVAAASAGVPRESIVLTWTATTQGITPVTGVAQSIATATQAQLAPTGLTTAAIGAAGIADIFIGVTTVPYYLDAPSTENPLAVLNGRWEAAPGAYVPPFDAAGLNPASTNITFANPVPVTKSVQTIPVVVTVPNVGSGQSAPDTGWPVVIYQHGITRNRTDLLAIADSLALAGFVGIAIDQPLHGITDITSPFYIGNTPFGAIPGASERTFDVDLLDNATGAPGPDGSIDSSGAHTINLGSLLTSRDNLRQATVDLFTFADTVAQLDLDGNGTIDVDASRIEFVGQSLGAMVGIPFLALEPSVDTGVTNVPGGGIANLLAGSATFGPQIAAGLQAAAGIEPGSADFATFLGAAQQILDAADPINYGALASANNAILLQEVIGDAVIPNSVPGAPLSGTEPLILVMGLPGLSETTFDPNGLRVATRFNVGTHGSLLDPTGSLEATVEMQTQMAAFVGSNGTLLQVDNPSVLVTGQ